MTDNTHPNVTAASLAVLKQTGEKIACLTAYDACFAALLERSGVEVVLVGDSLGMVLQGHESTLPVSMDDMVYHSGCVARALQHAWHVVDMPYKSYTTPQLALSNARRLLDEGGAQMVKLEGGRAILDVMRHLHQHGIPLCGHLGLLPQSIEELGGYRVQGRDADAAKIMVEDALALEEAGVELLVLECIPAALGAQISGALRIPTIGIGAGVDCDGQVLVLHDLLGVTSGKRPKFVRDFLAGRGSVAQALTAFVAAVKGGQFPDAEHSYK